MKKATSSSVSGKGKRGRPSKGSEARQPFQVRLSPEEKADLETISKAIGLEPSRVVRALIAALVGKASPFSSVVPAAYEKK